MTNPDRLKLVLGIAEGARTIQRRVEEAAEKLVAGCPSDKEVAIGGMLVAAMGALCQMQYATMAMVFELHSELNCIHQHIEGMDPVEKTKH